MWIDVASVAPQAADTSQARTLPQEGKAETRERPPRRGDTSADPLAINLTLDKVIDIMVWGGDMPSLYPHLAPQDRRRYYQSLYVRNFYKQRFSIERQTAQVLRGSSGAVTLANGLSVNRDFAMGFLNYVLLEVRDHSRANQCANDTLNHSNGPESLICSGPNPDYLRAVDAIAAQCGPEGVAMAIPSAAPQPGNVRRAVTAP